MSIFRSKTEKPEFVIDFDGRHYKALIRRSYFFGLFSYYVSLAKYINETNHSLYMSRDEYRYEFECESSAKNMIDCFVKRDLQKIVKSKKKRIPYHVS